MAKSIELIENAAMNERPPMSAFSPDLAAAERPAPRSFTRRARQLIDVALLASAIGFVALATLGGVGPATLANGPTVVAVTAP